MTQLPAVAKKVFYPCKKCETDRYQVVLAHTSLNAARLECEVCKAKNVFKIEEPRKTPKAGLSKRSVTNRANQQIARWNDLRERNDGAPTPYTMKSTFDVGTKVEHPKFGLGFVVLATGAAIQVIFEDGERSLVHNRV